MSIKKEIFIVLIVVSLFSILTVATKLGVELATNTKIFTTVEE